MRGLLYCVMSLAATMLLTAGGTEAAMSPGTPGDGVADLKVQGTGVLIDTDGAVLNGFILRSTAGLFTGDPYTNDLGAFVVDEDAEISDQFGYALDGLHDMGSVLGEAAPPGQLQQDLTMTYTIDAQPGIYAATIIAGFLGDLNDDGFVGQFDLDIVLGQWGKTGAEITDPRADPNGDDFVGQFDLDYVLADWGEGTPPTAPVPEPATLGIFALCGFALLRRKPKSR